MSARLSKKSAFVIVGDGVLDVPNAPRCISVFSVAVTKLLLDSVKP